MDLEYGIHSMCTVIQGNWVALLDGPISGHGADVFPDLFSFERDFEEYTACTVAYKRVAVGQALAA